MDAIAVELKPGVVGSAVLVVGSAVEAPGVVGVSVVLVPHPFPLPDPGVNGPIHTHRAESSPRSAGSPTQTPAPSLSPPHASAHCVVSARPWQTSSTTSTQSHVACVVKGTLVVVVAAKQRSLN